MSYVLFRAMEIERRLNYLCCFSWFEYRNWRKEIVSHTSMKMCLSRYFALRLNGLWIDGEIE